MTDPAVSPDVTRAVTKERARKTLGKAVHPHALARLFELWPDAVVSVRHGVDSVLRDEQKMGRSPYVEQRWTQVEVWRYQDALRTERVVATARCHLEDNFDRRIGIELAFQRALDKVRARRLIDFGSPERR